MQEELQKALSQIQSQAKTIKSLNEKIETMSESDLQLKEAEKKLEIAESINQSLDKKIDEAKSQIQKAELSIKESEEKEKAVKQQSKNMQEIIADSIAFRTEKARNKLELKYKAVQSILIIVLEIMLVGIVVYKTCRQFVKWFKNRMDDRWSLVALMIDLILIVISCDILKKYIGTNLILIMVVNYLGYMMVRGIVGAEDKNTRNVILVYAGGGVMIVAVAAVVIESFVNM